MAHRDPKTGRYARRPVSDVEATPEFDPMGSNIPFEDASGTPSPSTTTQPRYAPQADELAQGDDHSPLRSRRPTMAHPDDADFHNGILRSAARSAGPMDPTPFLVGLVGSPAPSRGVQSTRVEVHGDGNPLSPVRSQDIAPGRPVGRVRDVTDDEPMGTPRGDLRPAARGRGRARDR